MPPWLIATWVMNVNPDFETFTVDGDGTVSWGFLSQLGWRKHGTATVEVLSDGTFRVLTHACPRGWTPRDTPGDDARGRV